MECVITVRNYMLIIFGCKWKAFPFFKFVLLDYFWVNKPDAMLNNILVVHRKAIPDPMGHNTADYF